MADKLRNSEINNLYFLPHISWWDVWKV